MKKYIVTHWHDFQHHFHHENHPPKPHGEVEMTPEQEKHFKREGIRVLIGAFLIHFVLGCFYLWGGISLYVASYLRKYDSESIDIDLVKLVFPFMNVAINAVTSFGVKLADRITHQAVCFIGIVIIAGAVFAVSFIDKFIPFLIIYAVLLGVSSGLTYMVPVVCGWKYFPSKKGLISGFIIAGYGFGSLSFNQIALKIVNPDGLKASIPDAEGDHKYFGPEVYDNVPKMFKWLALLYLCIGLVGASLIKMPYTTPKGHHTQDPHHHIKKDKNGKVIEPHAHVDCENISEAVKTKPFWHLVLMVVCGSYFGLLMANNYKVYGLEQLDDDDFVTLVGSIGSACNGCSRLIWAALFDKFGFKRVYLVLMSIQIALAATLHQISDIKALYLIWYALIMATEGGQFSMMPAVTAKVFGTKKGPLIYGFIFFAFAVANMGSFFTTKFGLEDLGWGAIFWICFGLSCGAWVLNLLFNENFDDFKVKKGGHQLAEVHETHELQIAHEEEHHDHVDHHDNSNDDSPNKKI